MKKLIPLLLLVPVVVLAAGCDLAGITVTPSTQPPAISSFGASPPSIAAGASSTLSWSVVGATAVSIDQGIGNVALTGSRVVMPSATTVYTMTATNAAGMSATATAQVIVTGAPAPPAGLPVVNYFTADPPIISAGSSTTLSWSVSNSTSVTIDPGVGSVGSVGTASVSPMTSTSYTLTAVNAYGVFSLTIDVLVTGGGPHVAYDFVEMAPTAYWWTKIGSDIVPLPFPGDLDDDRGFATYRNNVKLNDGNTYTRVLETHPQWVNNGWISGKYSGVYVPPGAKLSIKVGLIDGASAGDVIFNIGKLGDPATINTNVFYGSGVKALESDLSAYAGQTIDFVINVNANGSSAQDWAAWAEAKIIY